MLRRWSEFERSFAALDELRRYMNLFDERGGRAWANQSTWPRMNLFDNGSDLVLKMAAPGLSEGDIELTLTGETLTIAGKREVVPPEGYSVHRQERGSIEFKRSFALPSRVDGEKVVATVTDGVMTVTMPKAAEDKPRQISVQAN